MYSNITPFTKYSGTPSRLKANGYFFLVPDQPTQKENFLFLDLNFSASLRINAASTVRFPEINPYCILSISTSIRNCLSKTLNVCSNSFIPVYEFELRKSPFRLIICTNELNIHSSGNLPSNKILNMAVKEFKQGSQ